MTGGAFSTRHSPAIGILNPMSTSSNSACGFVPLFSSAFFSQKPGRYSQRIVGHACFISYASEDEHYARIVVDRLRGAGIEPWFDKVRLRAVSQWLKEIDRARDDSRVILPIITPRWKQKQWTCYETYGAERIIPLLLEGEWRDVATPPLLRFQYLTLSNEDSWNDLFEMILEVDGAKPPPRVAPFHSLGQLPALDFVGRKADLSEILEAFFQEPKPLPSEGRVVAITGMPGTGKTSLARQYAEVFWRCYHQIFIVDCRHPLDEQFAHIYDNLNPPSFDPLLTDSKKREAIIRHLDRDKTTPRLLLIDNVENEASIKEFIPITGSCHTLVTSRFTSWERTVISVHLLGLDPTDSIDMLLRSSGHDNTNEEILACYEVIKHIGTLPLLLDVVGFFVRRRHYSFRQFIEIFEQGKAEFIRNMDSGQSPYPDALDIAIRAVIRTLSPNVQACLRIHSFLAATATPVELFVQNSAIVVGETLENAVESGVVLGEEVKHPSALEITNWIPSLGDYSIAETSILAQEGGNNHSLEELRGGIFSVHEVIHLVERDALGASQFRVYDEAVMLVLNYAKANLTTASKAPWLGRMLLPHVSELTTSAQLAVNSCEELSQLVSMFIGYLIQRGYRLEAVQLGSSYLQNSINPDPFVLDSHAYALEHSGAHSRAMRLQWQAFSILVKQSAPKDLIFKCILRLSVIRWSSGSYEKAWRWIRKAKAMSEDLERAEKPISFSFWSTYAKLLEEIGQLDEGIEVHKRVLARESEVANSHGPSEELGWARKILGDYDYLGQALLRRYRVERKPEDLAGAFDALSQGIAMQKRFFSENINHPHTAAQLRDLGDAMMESGDRTRASNLYEEALEICRNNLSEPTDPLIVSIEKRINDTRKIVDHGYSESARKTDGNEESGSTL